MSSSPALPRWIEPCWPAPLQVRAVSTFRGEGASTAPYGSLNLGDHVGDSAAAVTENRRRLQQALGLAQQPHWLRQVHGTAVADLDAGYSASQPADAVFTRQPGRICAILTADCLPILLTDEAGEVVAAAHAGWKGLAAGVIETTVRALKVPGSRLMAWLGPAIGPSHFEVGAEVREALLERDPEAGSACKANAAGRFMADLPLLARRRLGAVGVERVFGTEECTFARADRYFSHRRDGVTGRQATLIWLAPKTA